MTEPRLPLPDEAAASPPVLAHEAPPALAEPPATAPPAPRPRRVLTARNYAWIAGAGIVIFLGLRFLGPVLTPFLIGAILAYLGTPLVNWAQARPAARRARAGLPEQAPSSSSTACVPRDAAGGARSFPVESGA